MATTRFNDSNVDLDTLYGDLAAADLQPLWRLSGTLTPEPAARTAPYRWRGKHLRALCERSGELVTIDRGGDRRVLSCANPGLAGAPHATPTLWAGLQYLGPHESAAAHRHTPAALRFVFEGEGVWTAVDGDPVPMSRGDLILTPSWAFHEHRNSTAASMMWLDVLDVPLVGYLESVFFEAGSARPPARWAESTSTTELLWGAGPGLVPAGCDAPVNHSPLLAYRWSATDAALRRLAETTDSAVWLRFTDPARGIDVMPTMRCEMGRVKSGTSTSRHRQTGSRIGAVLNGTGTMTIGGKEFDVEHGDVFVVPSWSWFGLKADERDDLDIFMVSDAPILEATRLFRQEWAETPR
ncbi:cupin domain-containing protein [Nocardia sp. NPDC006044]|uniref:cupin domain-containing protein n=1 Tax=Nocardia sp. NPDC006044 TaxID=3364306 RepID=UPI00367E063F